ncbi:Peptide methionine sulfoxide reductase MsrA [Arcticibacter svalbardensis MN12-7]|uniref:Peptide methionine sulfoxide reductase MsrA n=1 Tax=Arcticibacter svalbardensis MN12-7 TaxID=1150600 RepID=R9GW16_9SPHI|nr:peptide-methionine (S)-S-oxide reductase MsrA [Arcticibacter svalbardensis]EOR95700.1 Peptide methionine sulfoxide reductase MsrA [Arcticibacter svalbardensis MN12-7]
MALEQATFGAGCFWCTEAVFQGLNGVSSSISGYMGGELPNPNYNDICRGNTGHAEVIQIDFDPSIVTYEELLLVFFKTHSPTSLNKQGNDSGTQYRSVIFYHNQEQKKAADFMIDTLTREMVYDKPIVTEIVPVSEFYKAEDYHQNFFNNNPLKAYCVFVIQPKLSKFTKDFKEKLKLQQ